MQCKRRISLFFITVFIAAAFAGCMDPSKYGRLRRAGPDMTIDQLLKDSKNYNVYYAGVNLELVNAILFDPKNDDRGFSLQHYWVSVNDDAKLSEAMRWINVFRIEPPSLSRIVGPGDKTFGYLYMLSSSPVIKVVDDKTLYLGNLSQRSESGSGIY